MTGTEAISNGVSAFEKPEADNAGKTLIAMAVLLGLMFLGITSLARTVQVMPVEHESVVYPGAPHSFFDRHQDEFADASDDAWRRMLSFVGAEAA